MGKKPLHATSEMLPTCSMLARLFSLKQSASPSRPTTQTECVTHVAAAAAAPHATPSRRFCAARLVGADVQLAIGTRARLLQDCCLSNGYVGSACV